MKRPLLLFVLIILMKIGFGACPPPYIQAVCEITKTDGTIVQGYILLGTYGCTNGLWMNGFLSYSDSIDIKSNYFTMDMKSIEFQDRIIINRFDGKRNSSPSKENLKYMIWRSNPTIYNRSKREFRDEDGKIIYTITLNREKQYVLLDSICIYHELDKYTFIPSDSNSNRTKISMTDILKISLLEKSEIPNLSDLVQKGIEANKMANGPNTSGDFQLPLWYHDIILNDKLLEQINKHIEDYTLKN